MIRKRQCLMLEPGTAGTRDRRRFNPSEPVTQLKRIPIKESGEPLVDFLAYCPHLRRHKPVFDYRLETLMRLGLADRLNEAATYLPDGVFLAILEGWRPPFIQERLYRTWDRFRSEFPDYSEAKLRRYVNRVCKPPGGRTPPPHTTGGAVDLGLVDREGCSALSSGINLSDHAARSMI
jgi:D-alanyl-D-alanine dipeptidase